MERSCDANRITPETEISSLFHSIPFGIPHGLLKKGVGGYWAFRRQ